MRLLPVLALVLALVAACSGGESGAERTTQARATEVPGCWRDAAERASRAADTAATTLPDEVARARRRYATLRAAAARGDAEAFTDIRNDFFRSLARIEQGRRDFEPRERRARRALTDCAAGEAGGEAVAACWRSVAATYQESLLAADRALGPLGGTLFFTVQRLVDAAEGGDAEAVQRAEARVVSAALRVQQAGDQFAASHRRADELYAECAEA